MLKLYRDIIEEVSYYERDMCIANFREFDGYFSLTFNVIDAEVRTITCFVSIIRINEKRRSLSKFFVLCANYDVIDKKDIEFIVMRLIKKIQQYITEKDMVHEVEEITENLKIMISNFNEDFKQVYSYQTIKQSVEDLYGLKAKDYLSLNNKVLFNFMDIEELM